MMKTHHPTGMLAHLRRALFSHTDDDLEQTREEHCWSIMYIDANGILQNTTVRLVGVHPGLRSLTLRREADEQEIIVRVSKIVEAIDIRTGRRIDLAHWLPQKMPHR